MNIRQSWGHLVQLLLSLPGIGVSIYLTAVHYNGAQLVCNNIGLINCERVLNSSYSLVPGTQVPISISGLAWFVVMAVLAVLGLCRDRQLFRQGELLWTALGMLTVFYLLYAEIVRLDAFCVWCTVLHILIFMMFLFAILFLRSSAEEDEEADVELEDEEDQLSPVESRARGVSQRVRF